MPMVDSDEPNVLVSLSWSFFTPISSYRTDRLGSRFIVQLCTVDCRGKVVYLR